MGIDPRQDFHERGFAGAILANHRMDFRGQNLKIYIFQGVHPRKSLGDAAHFRMGCMSPLCDSAHTAKLVRPVLLRAYLKTKSGGSATTEPPPGDQLVVNLVLG